MEQSNLKLTIVRNNYMDMVSDDLSCSSFESVDIDTHVAVCNSQVVSISEFDYIDNGPLTLADLECSVENDEDDMLSEISTVCYDETDHIEWEGDTNVCEEHTTDDDDGDDGDDDDGDDDDDDDEMEREMRSGIKPYDSNDLKEAERLGIDVTELFEYYQEINTYAEEQLNLERERCKYDKDEWPLHMYYGTYEDEGFSEYYYG